MTESPTAVTWPGRNPAAAGGNVLVVVVGGAVEAVVVERGGLARPGLWCGPALFADGECRPSSTAATAAAMMITTIVTTIGTRRRRARCCAMRSLWPLQTSDRGQRPNRPDPSRRVIPSAPFQW